ncbi:MAG: hypothetical protein R2784_06400 [Saprospiraceae bacterium]
MKKIFFQIFWTTILFTGFYSCTQETPDKSSTPITAEFYIRYLQTEDLFAGEVSFYSMVDSTAKFHEFDQVMLNGVSMEKRDIPGYGIRYRLELPASPGHNVTLSFNKKGEEKNETTFQIAPIKDFTFPEGISLNNGALLKMDTEIFGKNESLRILFTPENEKTGSVEIPSLAGKNEIKIPAQALISLQAGTNKVEMVRKKLMVKKEENITFNMLAEYYTTTKTMEISE